MRPTPPLVPPSIFLERPADRFQRETGRLLALSRLLAANARDESLGCDARRAFALAIVGAAREILEPKPECPAECPALARNRVVISDVEWPKIDFGPTTTAGEPANITDGESAYRPARRFTLAAVARAFRPFIRRPPGGA